jgi:hypothetical protein
MTGIHALYPSAMLSKLPWPASLLIGIGIAKTMVELLQSVSGGARASSQKEEAPPPRQRRRWRLAKWLFLKLV